MAPQILVVEDNEQNLVLMRDILTYHGYAVLTARNGEEGVRLAREERPDLILMDMQMPVLDGFTAVNILRRDPGLHGLKIIAVTSFAMAGDKEKALQAGCDDYLSKPVDILELRATVKKHLGEGKADGE